MTFALLPATAIPPEKGGTQDVFCSRRSVVPLPMMDRAEGIWFWDEDGRDYIDASSGPMVSALGHGNRHVIEAMTRQAGKLDYVYSRVGRNATRGGTFANA